MQIRGCNLNTSGPIWLFRPIYHKTAWRQKSRTIPIGPRCQKLLQLFLKPDPQEFLFNPRDGREEWFAATGGGAEDCRVTVVNLAGSAWNL